MVGLGVHSKLCKVEDVTLMDPVCLGIEPIRIYDPFDNRNRCRWTLLEPRLQPLTAKRRVAKPTNTRESDLNMAQKDLCLAK